MRDTTEILREGRFLAYAAGYSGRYATRYASAYSTGYSIRREDLAATFRPKNRALAAAFDAGYRRAASDRAQGL